MNNLHNIKIHLSPKSSEITLEIDGKQIQGLLQMGIVAQVDKIPQITITLIPKSLDIDGQSTVSQIAGYASD
jgi:hypothetical protein